MILDTEALILDRLRAKCAPGSIILGTLDLIDLTDAASAPVVAQVVLTRLPVASQTQNNTRLAIESAVYLYVDVGRATANEKTAAGQLLSDAMAALAYWEISPGKHTQLTDGDASGFDGRIMRLAFAFTYPAHVVGTP